MSNSDVLRPAVSAGLAGVDLSSVQAAGQALGSAALQVAAHVLEAARRVAELEELQNLLDEARRHLGDP